MPTTFSAKGVWLIAAACAALRCTSAPPQPAKGVAKAGGKRFAASSTSSANASDPVQETVNLTLPSGKTVRIPLHGDEYVRSDAGADLQVIAELGATLVLAETYLSRPGGGSYCQAGEERFLRILRLEASGPEETFRVKLASCWQEIELREPGIEWSAGGATLRVHWLFGPSRKLKPEELTLRLEEL